jgi:hypothetical protein
LRYKRWILTAGVCALAVLTLATATASAKSSSTKLTTTVTATVTSGTAWCCGRVVEFAGSETIMGIGAVDFTGRWIAGCSFPTSPTPCFRRLELVLVARNGDRLVLTGNDEWTLPFDAPPEATTWASDAANSTGRFADFAASGTYTLEVSTDGTSVTLTLSGIRQNGAS